MKRHQFSILLALIFCSFVGAQSEIRFPFVEQTNQHKFIQCAAILYNGKVLVDTYSTAGKCEIMDNLNGTLSVSTITFDESGMVPLQAINFRMAIKNDKSNTIWMYSDELLKEVRLESVLDMLGPNDRLIFMTTNDIYSLPHHEVAIRGGC